MKTFLFKALALICCITLCLGGLVACKDKTPDDPASTTAATTAAATTAATTAPVTEPPAPIPEEKGATLEVEDQKATADELISIEYEIPEKIADLYDHIEARVYHNDENGHLLFTTEIDETKTAADIKTSYGHLLIKLVGVKDYTATLLADDTASVWADEYNFASLNATFPVVYFTLELFSMEGDSKASFEAANEAGKNIQFIKNLPTFVSLERAAAYNWTELPEKVHPLPNATLEDSTTGEFHKMNRAIADYIKELHEINPESRFNLYCVDNYPELILKFFTAQGIDDDHFTATMISDGTASVSSFGELFAGAEDAEAKYNETKTVWETIKAKAAAGDPTYLDDVPYSPDGTYSILRRYAITIASLQDNVKWWCSRDNFTDATDSHFMKDLISQMNGTKIEYFGINDMLANLPAEDQAALKALFHFDGEMFARSEQEGKKSLVIIGTSWANEGNLAGYVKLLQAEFGDEYVVYYKGHPKYPTGLNQEKIDIFETHSVYDIDASIAAELILFYCPDIYLTGFASTTFKSVKEGKFLAMFDKTKAEGLEVATTNGYGDQPISFYTTVTVGEQTFVKIENSADDSVRYFNVASGEFVNTLPEA